MIGFGQEVVQKKFYYENGQLEAEGSFKNNNQDGLWKIYYENGQLKAEGNFNNDEKVGLWKGYYENGYIHWQKEYVFFEGTLDYTKQVYYFENGEVKQKIKLCCIEEDGSGGILYEKSWDENGNVISHTENYGWDGTDHRY